MLPNIKWICLSGTGTLHWTMECILAWDEGWKIWPLDCTRIQDEKLHSLFRKKNYNDFIIVMYLYTYKTDMENSELSLEVLLHNHRYILYMCKKKKYIFLTKHSCITLFFFLGFYITL